MVLLLTLCDCSTYQNSTSVTDQVNQIKSWPNLLLWYTADEPDGTSDPLSATVDTYNLINQLDPYHPVSLVLNCQDYYWTSVLSLSINGYVDV